MDFKYTEEDIVNAYKSMPSNIQELLDSDEIVQEISDISHKYGVESDKIDAIAREIGFVILMLKPLQDDYHDFLQKTVGDIPELNEYSQKINKYIKNLIDRLEKMMPRKTIDGDVTLWASEDGLNVITRNYFKLYGHEAYPLSYIRSVQLTALSGFDQPGSISIAVFGILIALVSLAMLTASNFIVIGLGIAGLYLSYLMIKTPFKKARPMGRIVFHPNLGLEPLNIGWLGTSIGMDDQDIIDFVKTLQKAIRN